MQVTETLNSGLKREIKITVPAGDMEAKLMARLSDARNKVRINGFRPGKVPVQHLRKVYGKSFMAEVVNEILNDSTRSIITGRGEKAAMQPEVIMTEDEKEAEKILAGGADFEFRLNYEVIPAIEIKDFSDIKVTRQVFEVPATEIDEQVQRVAESARSFEPKTGKAAEGDRVSIDYVGKIDGEAFSGGAGTDQPLVLGSKEFILEKLQPIIRNTGPSLSPFNAWVLVKGMETLGLRIERHCANAARVADALAAHPAIGRVLYPGRKDHPQHTLAMKQMSGAGGVVTFDLKAGKWAAFETLNRLKLVDISNNLGDAKSLVTHPATTTHMRIGAEERAKLGIGDGTVRISVGLEDAEDIIADLVQALG